MAHAPDFADLEILIRQPTDTGYPVKLVLDSVRILADGLLNPAGLPVYFDSNASAAGEQLFRALLGDPALSAAWYEARGAHPQRRIRLHIDAGAPALHALPWELLRDPGDGSSSAQDLAAAADTPLSRFPEQSDPVPPALTQRPLRIALAVAAPDDLAKPGLDPIDLAQELALLHAALDGLPDVELVETPQPCTLAAIEQTLRGCHVLHFVGNGRYNEKDGVAALYLADEHNQTLRTSDQELAEMIRRLGAVKPRLIFLASCQTAQHDPGDAFRGLAPVLIRAGAPAVLAMQGFVPVRTARPFAADFYVNLVQHGLLDLACNQARSHLISARLPEPALPMLFSRLPGGRLLATAAPAGRTVPQPPRAEHLFGRSAFQDQLTAELTAAGGQTRLALTALRGLPGVGKSALAKALANDPAIERAFPDGRAWLELGPQADLFQLLGQILADFGASASDLSDVPARAARLRSVLEGRRYLLVLDDVWQAAHARPFLEAVQPPARALLTTRSPQVATDLQAANHEVWKLKPDAARAMLVEASPDARLAVEADEEGARVLAEKLGHLPLALKVAGRRLARLARAEGPAGAVAQVQTEMATRLLALPSAEGRAGLAGAEPSLEAILALSYDALPNDAARAAFRGLAVFGGQPRDYDAAAMAAVWQVDEERALDLRLALVDAGLVETPKVDGRTRYALHQVIAAFADARLALDPGAKRAAALFHARHYAGVLGGYASAVSAGLLAFNKLSEWENIAVALEYLADQQTADDEAATILLDCAKTWRNVIVNNYDSRRMGWLQAAVAAAKRVGDRLGEAYSLKAIGDVQNFRKEMDAALVSYRQALELFRSVGDRLGEANSLKAIGDVQNFRKEMDAALVSYRQALELFRSVGDRLGEANSLQAIGDVQNFRKEMDAALVSYRQALELFRSVGDRLGEANSLQAIGDVQNFRDDRDAALDSYRQALELFRSVGDRLGEANSLQAIGDVQNFRDDRDAALDSYRQALELFRSVGSRLGEANSLQAIGDVQNFRKEMDAALVSYRQALELFRSVGSRLGEANSLKAIGDVQNFRKEMDAALVSYRQALELFRSVGSRLGEANSLKAIGDVQNFRDDRDAALVSYRQALELFRSVGDRLGEANVLLAQGDILREQRQFAPAWEKYTQVRALYAAIGDRYSLARVLYRMGDWHVEQGQRQPAAEMYRQAIDLWRSIGVDDLVESILMPRLQAVA
jgi:tetratricopeptide (TPR) repeat protein